MGRGMTTRLKTDRHERPSKILPTAAKKARLTRGQKTWLAITRFAPMRDGEAATEYPTLREAFKKKYDKNVGIRTIQNAIREAFESELVALRPTFNVPDYARNSILEKTLEEKFPQLKYAIVPEIGEGERDYTYPILGRALAEHIQDSRNLFRPGDAIGLGSDRSVFWTVSALNGFESVHVSPIILASLTGCMFTKNKTAPAGELLDGDTHLTLLLQHFGLDLQIRLVGQPIAQNSESARNAALKSTWLGDFDRHVPTHAIVGCGVLDHDGHRFNQERTRGRQSDTLKPVAVMLEHIMKRMDEIKERHPSYNTIIGDVCNRFFVVPPPRPLFQDLGLMKQINEIRAAVDNFNKRLVTISKHQLSRVNNVMLIGGPGKESALHYLLNLKFQEGRIPSYANTSVVDQPERFKVDTLCVDANTAMRLIEISSGA